MNIVAILEQHLPPNDRVLRCATAPHYEDLDDVAANELRRRGWVELGLEPDELNWFHPDHGGDHSLAEACRRALQ